MNILIIDPSPLFRSAACNFIGGLPCCEGIAAASLHDALGLAATREADLVLIDWALCHADGDRAPGRIKALAPTARVLLLTEDAADYRKSCLAAGADGSFAKDDLGRALPQLVGDLMRQTGKEPA